MRANKVYLIVGLGNPGTGYKDTRHNIGSKVIDLWSRDLGLRLTGHCFQSRTTETRFQNKKTILLCPQTFMNRSGESVRASADYYGVETGNILVVHDDIDLSVGRVKVVRNGGAGGHKGTLSIIQHLGSMQFPRVKIGIGRPRHGEDIEDYVLLPFYSDERNIMGKAISLAIRACELFVPFGVESAMNYVNCQNRNSLAF